MIDSQCCTAQTNTTLLSNCIPIDKKKKKEKKEGEREKKHIKNKN